MKFNKLNFLSKQKESRKLRKVSKLKFLKSRSLKQKFKDRHKLCLMRVGRVKKPFYKIVIVNGDRSLVDIIGFYNPFLVQEDEVFEDFLTLSIDKNKNLFYKHFVTRSDFFGNHIIGLNFDKMAFWLQEGVEYDGILHRVLVSIFKCNQNFREILDYEFELLEGKHHGKIANLLNEFVYGTTKPEDLKKSDNDDVVDYINTNWLKK